MDSIDSVVIGAGVIGLAIGRAIALSGREVVVLERNDHIGEETSSRNSEVIHAGIYYPTNSLKASLCVNGKEQLYTYAASRGVDHSRIGKVIVAVSDAQMERLRSIADQASINGVKDLEWLDHKALAQREPKIAGVAGLWSPSTGIIDGHGLMLSLQADLEDAGGTLVARTALRGAKLGRKGVAVSTVSDGASAEFLARRIVNAAGLCATDVARVLPHSDELQIPAQYYARGNYFLYRGRSPFKHLVYPIPVAGGLGIHATLDLAGNLRFGPDVEWIDEIDYTIDTSRADAFYRAIRDYWPDLPDGSLRPGYAGVRPKISAPGKDAADFLISGDSIDGARLVHLFGIESPGLTACLAIAEHVVAMLSERT